MSTDYAVYNCMENYTDICATLKMRDLKMRDWKMRVMPNPHGE